MSNVYLLIGGNRGDRLSYLKEAVNRIRQDIGSIILSSSVYETEPYGFKDESMFLNQCLLVETELQPRQILKSITEIETSLGRKKKKGTMQGRTIDIDILFYDDLIIHNKWLIIPHPEFHKRNFAIIPVSEINPGFIHPVFGKKVKDLLEESTDTHKVAKFSGTRN
jgi:2-amino-4-hydroxy-6-hydroxymethyldihydropteridine diphosphokinase